MALVIILDSSGRCGWQVLFDTLKYHGGAFTTPFWTRIIDSVLLPIFDHVRAEVGRNTLAPHAWPAPCVQVATGRLPAAASVHMH